MKKSVLLYALLFCIPVMIPNTALAQSDWQTLWINTPPPPTQPAHPNHWMIPPKSYTGIAYDKWRDVLYVVHPDSSSSPTAQQEPRIYAWNALDGTPATHIGRSAFPAVSGQGGELPVPLDTIAMDNGMPQNRSVEFNRYSVYRIDLDDEGRIFACNVVAPLWGINILLPSGKYDSLYLNQGPFRLWRWNTPVSTPRLVYATLNDSATAIGQLYDSEMTFTRWGDALDVIGKRALYTPQSGPSYMVDSARIYVSGGSYPTQPAWNNEVDVILADDRPEINRPAADVGNYKLDYRLAVRLVNSGAGIASHGVAATEVSLMHDVWMNANPQTTSSDKCVQDPTAPWPQTYHQPVHQTRYLNPALTGKSGPIRYFKLPEYGREFIVVAGGTPTGGFDPTIPNDNTRARVVEVTPGAEKILWSVTPPVGDKIFDNNIAVHNWITDVDIKLEYATPQDDPINPGLHITLFVLMSNNGIAAFRSRLAFPVELTSLTAALHGDAVDLHWKVAMELNNHGFEVQRSFNDGRLWETIGFVAGRGSISSAATYTYTDPVSAVHRNVGTVQYRLRQVDTDGSAHYSPVVTIQCNATASGLALSQNYPNPFNPASTISYQLPTSGYVTLRVFNMMGECVRTLADGMRNAGQHHVSISADGLLSGPYIYQLQLNGSVLQKRMTVLK